MTAQFDEFMVMLRNVTMAFNSSDLGQDAVKDGSAMVWLSMQDGSCSARATAKGLDVRSSCKATGTDGRLCVPFGALERLNVKADTIMLASDTGVGALKVKAGRFKAEFPLVTKGKPAVYPDVALTHKFDASDILDAMRAVDFSNIPYGHPNVRLRAGPDGVRVWTHTDFNASWAHASKTEHLDLDMLIRARALQHVAQAADAMLEVGTDGRSWRARSQHLDITHPVFRVDVIDVDAELAKMAERPGANFTIPAKSILEAINAVGVTADDKRTSTVLLSLLVAKNRLVVSGKSHTGWSSYRLSVKDIRDCAVEQSCSVNSKVLYMLVGRLKDRDVRVNMLADRLVLRSEDVAFMVTHVKEEEVG